MKNIILICSCIIMTAAGTAQPRELQTLQRNWKFSKGPLDNAQRIDYDDRGWQTVDLPHDWAIAGPFDPEGDGSTAKLPWKGEGWYRYTFTPPSADQGKRIYLLFDGVMAFPSVYVNGQLAGKWDYGYNSFYVDITPHVRFNQKNVIAVHADTRQHDSRWYPGAGIYRKVQLLITPPVHIDIWGIHIATPIIKTNYAQVEVETHIKNTTSQTTDTLTLEQTIYSPKGKPIVTQKNSNVIRSQSSRSFYQNFILNQPERWEIGHGVLYMLKSVLKKGNEVLDVDSNYFGVRTIRFTADDGFYLNDRRVQLKGVNLHHDHGPLGAAFYPRAMERQLDIMVEMGCNAIRTSHNVPAPELLDMCDRMGILVFDEIFDKYDRKAGITDTTDFDAFAERNIRYFIQRDRNHPSIFLWSVGNEIGDVQWNIRGGFDKLRTMVNLVQKYDPFRPVTLVCDNRNSARLRHFDFYDVHAWNYGRRYDLARQLESNKSVIISESASTVSTRGFYEWPLPRMKTDFTTSLQVSSYDLHAPEWAEISDDDFMWQQDEHYIAGEFVWTGFDYIGEPTPYTNHEVKRQGMTDREASVSSYFGIVDLVGIPKDRYYLYKSYWKQEDTTIHILPHWNWAGKEGDTIPVFVYTNGDCAELFVNDQSYGMKCKKPDAQNSTERFRLMWHDVIYQPGEVKAIAYKEGEQSGEVLMKTTGDAVAIKLTADRTDLKSDGMDLSYVMIEAMDENGLAHPLADHEIHIDLSGPASIAGVGNGDPQSLAPFQSDRVKLFFGKAMVIVKAGYEEGEVRVRVKGSGLKGGEVKLTVRK